MQLFATHRQVICGEMPGMKLDQLPDDDPDPPSTQFDPSEEWIDAFDEQCTEALFQSARRFAAYRARFLGCGTPRADAYYARELVQNALADTLLGALQWDPSVQSLKHHILDAIRLRARRDRTRAERFPHESIDAGDPDDESSAMAEAEAALAADAANGTAEEMARAAATMSALRTACAGNLPALRYLDAVERGVVARPDLMRIAGLTRDEYHNARRRLARLVTQLPYHLQPRRAVQPKESDHD